MLDFRALWQEALTFDAFLAASTKHRGLWEGLHRIARIPDWALRAVPPGGGATAAGDRGGLVRRRVEHGAGAGPIVPSGAGARAADRAAGREPRGDGPVPDQRHPVDSDRDRARRGVPRAGPLGSAADVLQDWVLEQRQTVPKAELYPQVRQWYARDHGETTIREVLEIAGFTPAKVA